MRAMVSPLKGKVENENGPAGDSGAVFHFRQTYRR